MDAISEEVDQIIRKSLEKEIQLLEMKKRITDDEIRDFERRCGIDSDEFLRGFESGALGDSEDYFEWWGLLQGRKAVAEELKKARALLSS